MREKGEKRRERHVTRRRRLRRSAQVGGCASTGIGVCRYRVRAMQGYAEHRSEAVLTQD